MNHEQPAAHPILSADSVQHRSPCRKHPKRGHDQPENGRSEMMSGVRASPDRPDDDGNSCARSRSRTPAREDCARCVHDA